MRFLTARQAWHDAFMSDVKSTDTRELLNTFGVQFTVKGAGSKVMDQCEKGIIQNAIAKLKQRDRLAHSWGMFAYTPDGWPAALERGHLLGYLVREYNQWTDFERHGDKLHQDRVCMLARLAMHEVARRDLGQAGRADMTVLRKAVGCADDTKRWDKEWKPVWRKLNAWLDPLTERALGPVSAVVRRYKDKQSAA